MEKNVSNEPEIDELELMLMAAELNCEEDLDDGAENNSDVTKIQKELERFKRLKRLDKGASVLNFWKTNKNNFPLLYELAQVFFSVANGQTSVERGFSSLDFIFDRRRCNLNADTLNDILMIRLNSSVLDKLNDSDWDKILETQVEHE